MLVADPVMVSRGSTCSSLQAATQLPPDLLHTQGGSPPRRASTSSCHHQSLLLAVHGTQLTYRCRLPQPLSGATGAGPA